MVNKRKQANNLFTYAIIMIICVIIIILIAAMADNREEEIDNRINETEQTSANIQNQLVELEDENYALKKQNQEYADREGSHNDYVSALGNLTSVWNLYSSGDVEGAKAALAAVDTTGFDENQLSYYNALYKLLGLGGENPAQ